MAWEILHVLHVLFTIYLFFCVKGLRKREHVERFHAHLQNYLYEEIGDHQKNIRVFVNGKPFQVTYDQQKGWRDEFLTHALDQVRSVYGVSHLEGCLTSWENGYSVLRVMFQEPVNEENESSEVNATEEVPQPVG